jgi:acetyl-CoA decarbonylase/synthase complex subunit gamma
VGGGIDESAPGFLGWLDTPAGKIARVATEWSSADRLGAWKVRWAIGRMNYLVPPGLYAIGNPAAGSPVIVTANYKLTFDLVRRALEKRDAWLLVLETHGINVWCAGGKGTFGTGELVRRIGAARLDRVVDHRTLLLPLLSANGVCARHVKSQTGFEARFAAIRADDLPEYLDNGFKTTDAMRRLTFSTRERLSLMPVEWLQAIKASLPFLAASVAAGMVASFDDPFSASSFAPATALFAAACTGSVGVPLLLPWLPGRSFAFKGALLGLLPAAAVGILSGWRAASFLPALLALPAVSAFFGLTFTGSTPFTSRSGVKKEIRLGLPPMAAAALSGVLTWAVVKFAGSW